MKPQDIQDILDEAKVVFNLKINKGIDVLFFSPRGVAFHTQKKAEEHAYKTKLDGQIVKVTRADVANGTIASLSAAPAQAAAPVQVEETETEDADPADATTAPAQAAPAPAPKKAAAKAAAPAATDAQA